MDTQLVFVFGALILRFLQIVSATLFCWLGYQLFARTRQPGGAEFSYKDAFRVNLYQIGPGVFFSLFGAAVLVYGISNPPSIQHSPHGPFVGMGATPAAPAADVDRAEVSRAAAAIAFVNRIEPSGSVSAQDRGDIPRMSRHIRLSIMRSVWQADWGDPADFEAWMRDPTHAKPNPQARAFFERS